MHAGHSRRTLLPVQADAEALVAMGHLPRRLTSAVFRSVCAELCLLTSPAAVVTCPVLFLVLDEICWITTIA